jgi:hypothetical protein
MPPPTKNYKKKESDMQQAKKEDANKMMKQCTSADVMTHR